MMTAERYNEIEKELYALENQASKVTSKEEWDAIAPALNAKRLERMEAFKLVEEFNIDLGWR